VHVNGGIGERPGDVPDTSGVVEMDVRHGYAGKVFRAHAVPGQGVKQCRRRALAARFDQDGSRPFDQVTGRHPLPASEQGVYLQDAGSDVTAHRWQVSARPPYWCLPTGASLLVPPYWWRLSPSGGLGR
jgi:hypothetical protein